MCALRVEHLAVRRSGCSLSVIGLALGYEAEWHTSGVVLAIDVIEFAHYHLVEALTKLAVVSRRS